MVWGLNPAGYVQFLAGAYQTIKAKDANIIVISVPFPPREYMTLTGKR